MRKKEGRVVSERQDKMEVVGFVLSTPLNGAVQLRRTVRCSVYDKSRSKKASMLVRSLSANAKTFFTAKKSSTTEQQYAASGDDRQSVLKLFRQLALLGKIFSVFILFAASIAVVSIAKTQAVFIVTLCAAVLGGLALHVVYQQLEFMMCSVASNALNPTLYVSRKPKNIYLMRHGESEGNVDRSLYRVLPDNKLELTEKGRRQSFEAGKRLKAEINDENTLFYVSPYVRTRQTLSEVLEGGAFKNYTVLENPHLREQEFGNFQDPDLFEHYSREREACGWFYHRVPGGESGADLYTRAMLFLDTMFRDVDLIAKSDRAVENVVIISHGLTMRLICMRYFNWSVEDLQQIRAPDNVEAWKLERSEESSGYNLATEVSPIKPVSNGATTSHPKHKLPKECQAWETWTERWQRKFFGSRGRTPRTT